MSEKVEIDAEVLQYLCETAVAHNLVIQMLLGLEELRSPGFAVSGLREIDKILGQRRKSPVEQGWINIRARMQADLGAAAEVQNLRPHRPLRDAAWNWLTGWRAERKPR